MKTVEITEHRTAPPDSVRARLEYIDGLRGYAILMVMAVHASLRVPRLEWPLADIMTQGARGVQLFFTVSALTLMMSWHRRRDGIAPFYLRRLFRIAPMFWLAMVAFIVLLGTAPRFGAPFGVGWMQVTTTLTFTHGFRPDTIESIVPGGWSIAVEMTFYALFPWIATRVSTLRHAFLLLMGAIVFAVGLRSVSTELLEILFPDDPKELRGAFGFLWFPAQLPAFAMGILLFHALRSGVRLPAQLAHVGFLVSLGLVGALPLFGPGVQSNFLLSGAALGVMVLCASQSNSAVVVHPAVRWIGKVSFSAYLWHFLLLSLPVNLPLAEGWPGMIVTYGVLAAATVALSSLTYLLVEVPMIAMGDGFIRRVRAKHSQVAPA
jgi:exopolysaccharide production protein ExoZ